MEECVGHPKNNEFFKLLEACLSKYKNFNLKVLKEKLNYKVRSENSDLFSMQVGEKRGKFQNPVKIVHIQVVLIYFYL